MQLPNKYSQIGSLKKHGPDCQYRENSQSYRSSATNSIFGHCNVLGWYSLRYSFRLLPIEAQLSLTNNLIDQIPSGPTNIVSKIDGAFVSWNEKLQPSRRHQSNVNTTRKFTWQAASKSVVLAQEHEPIMRLNLYKPLINL